MILQFFFIWFVLETKLLLYSKMALVYYLGTLLIEFSHNPSKVDKKLNIQKHGFLMSILTRDNMDLRSAFYDFAKNKDLSEDQSIIDTVKDIAIIKSPYISSFDAFDEKTMTIKTELITFLAIYLIKRRATYLYIYMLFHRKHFELLRIQKALSDKYYEFKKIITAPGGNIFQGSNIIDFLTELENELLDKTKASDKLINIIKVIFAKAKGKIPDDIDHLEIFGDIGTLLYDLNLSMEGYKKLVTDVIPLMSEWHENSI